MSDKTVFRQNAEKSQFWQSFVVWAEGNDVSLDNDRDWGPWWTCFWSGAACGLHVAAGGNKS